MSYFWAKVLGGLVCLAFLATLKPLLQALANLVPAEHRSAYRAEVSKIGTASNIDASVLLPLVAGLVIWIGVGAALSDVAGELSAVIGGVLGFSVLYPYFFIVTSRRAKAASRAVASTQL